jgi:hypothetical protein
MEVLKVASQHWTFLSTMGGIVGGSFVTFEEIGRKAAQASLRILAGESPQDVGPSEIGQLVPMFDWRELRRRKISERRLPPGSVMLFREATYWEKYHWLILGVVSAFLIEGLLIAVLFAQLRRRRQAEASLRESEERLNLAMTSAGRAFGQSTRLPGEYGLQTGLDSCSAFQAKRLTGRIS